MEEEKSIEFTSMSQTKDDFATTDFDHSGLNVAEFKADLEFVRPFLDERDLKMLHADIGEGRQLGNSRTIIRHAQQAAQRIRAMVDSQTGSRGLYADTGLTDQQRRELQGEAKTLISRALMEARSEWIRRSGRPLDGY